MTSYQDWARAFHGHAFLQRSAERQAAFLLPSLQAGARVLDIGCGPGAITKGLTEYVAPGGEVVGVDHDDAWVMAAQAAWTATPGLRFERADAAQLPFEDGEFDAAFLHAVLQHVDSPDDVAQEVRRVVRPGGVIGVADADLGWALVHPLTDELRAAIALDRRTRRNPDIGRRLPELLLTAGFADVAFMATTNVVYGEAAIIGVAESSARRLEAEPFVVHAIEQGWVEDGSVLAAMAAAWRSWATAPGALFVSAWCQVVAS